MKKGKLSILLFACILFSSCDVDYSYYKYTCACQFNGSEFVNPLNCLVTSETFSDKAFKNTKDIFDERIWKIHKYLDRYNDYEDSNNLKTINDSYGLDTPIKVDDELFYIIKLGKKLTKLTDGNFNIAMGSIIDVWNGKFNYPGTISKDIVKEDVEKALTAVPTVSELDDILILNEENKTVTLKKLDRALEDVKLSFGGIAKGYALDYAKDLFYNKYPTILNAGSSSMAMIGTYPGTTTNNWNVKYRNPSFETNKSNYLLSINFKGDMGLSTSGDYIQNFIIKDEDGNSIIRHHILDMNTGYSNNYHRAVGAISTDAPYAVLDAITTAIFNIKEIDKINEMLSRVESDLSIKIDYYTCDSISGNDINEFNLYITSDMKKIMDDKYTAKEIKNIYEIKK